MSELMRTVRPLAGRQDDFDAALERIGDAKIVLLGEASFGTQQFHDARAAITRRLIEEKGFAAVGFDADSLAVDRVARFVAKDNDSTAEQALADFTAFPSWVWRNRHFVRFARWLRDREGAPVEVRGLDAWGTQRMLETALVVLEAVAPQAAGRLRARVGSFGDQSREGRAFARTGRLMLTTAQLERALDALRAHRETRIDGERHDPRYDEALLRDRVEAWNLRQHHLLESVERLRRDLAAAGRADKICVWSHNAVVGDARASAYGRAGHVSLGQLLRERLGAEQVATIGFTTYGGTVAAAASWGAPVERRRMRPAFDGSWEKQLSEVGVERFVVVTRDAREALSGWRLHRAIGPLYLPWTDRASHYYPADLAGQYDVVVHYDTTTALEPLEGWTSEETRDELYYPIAV